jgi:hypothetical protein
VTAPRLALVVTALAGAAWCWHAAGIDRGDDIGSALRSGQWRLAQERIDDHRRRHGRSAELARWQTALDLAARGSQVAQEGHAPVATPPDRSIDTPVAATEFADARRAAADSGVGDSDDRRGGGDDHGIAAPAVLVTR